MPPPSSQCGRHKSIAPHIMSGAHVRVRPSPTCSNLCSRDSASGTDGGRKEKYRPSSNKAAAAAQQPKYSRIRPCGEGIEGNPLNSGTHAFPSSGFKHAAFFLSDGPLDDKWSVRRRRKRKMDFQADAFQSDQLAFLMDIWASFFDLASVSIMLACKPEQLF